MQVSVAGGRGCGGRAVARDGAAELCGSVRSRKSTGCGRCGRTLHASDPEPTKRAALLSPPPVALFIAYGERVRGGNESDAALTAACSPFSSYNEQKTNAVEVG
jgi:hypothetical protein